MVYLLVVFKVFDNIGSVTWDAIREIPKFFASLVGEAKIRNVDC
jgi:hypothetical protein